MNKKFISLGLASVAVLSLAACGNRGASKGGAAGKTDLKVAMVTDTGGVDDKSFNQSAWEGLQSWGKEMGLQKGTGFDYFQSTSESEYATNLDTAVSGGYQLIYGIGFALKDAIAKAAGDNEGVKFVIIDDIIEGKDNVASVTFADHEAAYLAGIAAAKTTKTKTVGFVGGMEGTVITRFEKGFEAGVKSVDDTIQVKVDYAGSFGDAAKGKQSQQLSMQQVLMLFTRQQEALEQVYLMKQKLLMKNVVKLIKFGLLVLTVIKKTKENTLLKMAKKQTLYLHHQSKKLVKLFS